MYKLSSLSIHRPSVGNVFATYFDAGFDIAGLCLLIAQKLRRYAVERFGRDPNERFSHRVETLVVDRDLKIDGVVTDLVVTSGGNVVVTGVVERSLRVDRGAVVYVDGLVDGTATVSGALCIDSGHVARTLRGSGVVFDPTEPADSEVG